MHVDNWSESWSMTSLAAASRSTVSAAALGVANGNEESCGEVGIV